MLARHRAGWQVAVDAAAWAAALVFATLVRFDLHLSEVDARGLAAIVPLAVLAQVVAGLGLGLYTNRWRFGSFDEVAALAKAAALTTALIAGLDVWVTKPRMVPFSAALAGGVAALVLMGATRYVWRLAIERRLRPRGDGCERLIVLGAGEGGAQVITSMLRDPLSPYLPVALLDDDAARANLQIMGVRVVGTRNHLAAAAARYDATGVLIAIPSAGADVVAEVTDLAREAGLSVKVLPPVAELFGDGVGVDDIRDVSEVDLLGRRQVETDVDDIAGYLAGRRVLVTGAGGSIGSELCRQIYRFAPAELVMVDRDESALHDVQLSIEGRSNLDSPSLVLADLREPGAADALFVGRDVDVVFHAAALKHVPLLERHPAEAVRANVDVTRALLEAAASHGVDRFVNISTDKAADPINVLGFTKRIGERLTSWYATAHGRPYLSVRFGNVLGSRGSVLSVFRAQIAAGGPVTVTDPDVTRYFMTVQEAVQLVIQAGAIGAGGEALVLDMGEPVRIVDVVHRLTTNAIRPIDVVFTGLRGGEKLHEVLLGAHEEERRSVHPLIAHISVPPLPPEAVARLAGTDDALRDELRAIACGPSVGVAQEG